MKQVHRVALVVIIFLNLILFQNCSGQLTSQVLENTGSISQSSGSSESRDDDPAQEEGNDSNSPSQPTDDLKIFTTGRLAFSDLISGPDTGLGDGLGSGVIVTVWGYGLKSAQGTSQIHFCDSENNCRVPYVYYWKNADGQLPSGPANLYASHGMQEIAFSIPDSAGLGKIRINVDGINSELPFTVRAGSIYHMKSTGSDLQSAPGTWNAAWRTLTRAIGESGYGAPAGSTVYLHDVALGSSTTVRAGFGRYTPAASGKENQFAVVAYPNQRPTLSGQIGLEPYRVSGMVASKLDVYASNYTSVDANDQHTGSPISSVPRSTFAIETSKDGRVIANRITDLPGGCASGMNGAIVGGRENASNVKIYGNEIHDYGCAGSSKLHHTTYMSVRSDGDDLQVEPWEFGYNYLHDNPAKFGIHQFDQDYGTATGLCGDLTGPLRIHNNVIVNQGGGGISIGSQCNWTMDAYIENNIIINAGLPAAWDGININTSDGAENGAISIRDSGSPPTGGLTGTMYVRNNLIYKTNHNLIANQSCFGFQGSSDNVRVEFDANICHFEVNAPYIGIGYLSDSKADNITGSRNVFFSLNGTNVPPAWDTQKITSNPMLTRVGSKFLVNEGSPVIGRAPIYLSFDIYGKEKSGTSNIGPVQ